MSTSSERHYYYDGYLLCVEHAPAPDSTEGFFGGMVVCTARERFYIGKELGSRVICDKCISESAAK
jgi:hypothetical protein